MHDAHARRYTVLIDDNESAFKILTRHNRFLFPPQKCCVMYNTCTLSLLFAFRTGSCLIYCS